MTRDQARAFVELHASATTGAPALTEAEVDLVLDGCRIVDAGGRRITDPGYVETIWGTKAVVDVLDAKLAKAAGRHDVTADGTRLARSQVTAHLTALRRSWRARMLPGSV